jgi:hypothetical protein
MVVGFDTKLHFGIVRVPSDEASKLYLPRKKKKKKTKRIKVELELLTKANAFLSVKGGLN